MTKEEQIEEMSQNIAYSCIDLVGSGCCDNNCPRCLAEALYEKVYRKQREGKWVRKACRSGLFSIDYYFVCTSCDNSFVFNGWDYEDVVSIAKYCPNCGARMKGGE